MTTLQERVCAKINELGLGGASEYFGVSIPVVRSWLAGTKKPTFKAAEKVMADEFSKAPVVAETSTAAVIDGMIAPANQSDTGRAVAANWEGKQVILCLPWYKTVNPLTTFSIMAMLDREKMGVMMVCGDAFISHTRNRLAQLFLNNTKAEWSMWFDDDMIFPMGNAQWFAEAVGYAVSPQFAGLHTINRLISHKKTLVGGLYFGRTETGRPMYSEGCSNVEEAKFARSCPQDTVKPTRWVATGCMLVHRSVFEAIDSKFPHLRQQFFSPSEHNLIAQLEAANKTLQDTSTPAEARCNNAFQQLLKARSLVNANSRVGMGEDVVFCVRAAAAGHQPHVDCGLVCGHVGYATFGPRNTHPA
jgi:hypothetical protein